VDVKEAISDTVTLLSHGPDINESISIETELPDAPVIINADVSQLKQIFWNLSRNAIQALRGEGNLSVSLKSLKSNRIRIVFEDNGCGMPREQVEKLFEPFSVSTTGGTGLGLSIVYQIVKDHNGTVNITSKEDTGTKITIEFPTDYVRASIPGDPAAIESNEPELVLKEYLKVERE
jgi:signal transduction histidine kinase